MFDRHVFLARVLAKAGTQRAVLDVLGLPSSRGPELFDRNRKKRRGLSVEEAVMLAESFDVPLEKGAASAKTLVPILSASLRRQSGVYDTLDIERLADDIVFGLKLQSSMSSLSEGNEDAEIPVL